MHYSHFHFRQDASTSMPSAINSSKRKCSHTIRNSSSAPSRRRQSSQASILLRGQEASASATTRIPRKRSRTFSLFSISSYLYLFWTPDEESLFLEDEEEEDEEEPELEPGCCNACWDKDVPWCQARQRISSSASAFKVFALAFCLLGAATYSLHQVSKDFVWIGKMSQEMMDNLDSRIS